MIQKVFIGGQWKGVGDKWVDDEPSRCVDCLNVYATQNGSELRRRPGIEHSIDTSGSTVSDVCAIRRKDEDDTIAVLVNDSPYGTISRKLKQDSSGSLSIASYSASQEANFPTYNKQFTAKCATPYGNILMGDRYALMVCDRYWGYDYDGTNRDYGLLLNMARRAFDRAYSKELGLYGMLGTYKEQLADGGSGSGILEAGTYGVFAVFEYRLPDNTYFGETTPYYFWYGEEATVTLAASNSKITVTLPYKKSSTWNLHDLGYDYDCVVGSSTYERELARCHFRPVKIRVYRTLKDLTGYYLLEKEIDISSVSHDSSGYITFDVGASGDPTDDELVEEYINWRIMPAYMSSGEWYANRLFVGSNEIYARITGNNHIYFSEVNNPFKFDPNNYLTLNAEDPITGLIGMPARGMMLILTTKGVQYLSGTSVNDFVFAPMAHGSGCAWYGAFAKYRNNVFWAGRDGIYVLGEGAMENISPTIIDQKLLQWRASYSDILSAYCNGVWLISPRSNSENCLVVDVKTNSYWLWDIKGVDVYDPPISKTVPPDSWDITTYDADEQEKDAGSTTIIVKKDNYIGTILSDSLTYGGSSEDDTGDFDAYFLTSWQQFGTTDVKRIGRVRLHASQDTRIRLRVEASPNPTFDTNAVPTAREMILTGSDLNQVSDIGIAGRYIRFKIEAVSGYEMVIYGLEVEIETDG